MDLFFLPWSYKCLDEFVYYKQAAFTSQDINWWTGVVWIIVMFLSAVWTLILTAPIHCRECFGEQIMSCKVMPISYLLNVTVKGVAHRTRSAVSHRAVSLKFEHIVFYVCTHTGGSFGICPQSPAATQDTVQIPAAPQSAFCIVLY